MKRLGIKIFAGILAYIILFTSIPIYAYGIDNTVVINFDINCNLIGSDNHWNYLDNIAIDIDKTATEFKIIYDLSSANQNVMNAIDTTDMKNFILTSKNNSRFSPYVYNYLHFKCTDIKFSEDFSSVEYTMTFSDSEDKLSEFWEEYENSGIMYNAGFVINYYPSCLVTVHYEDLNGNTIEND